MASVPTQSDSQICKKKRNKKQQQNRVKMITGYIIYASEIRREIIKKNPDKDFGGISKIVGAEWKNLPQETKVTYEKRAQEQNSLSRMLFANEPLNKLADVAAARAAEAEELQANSCNSMAAVVGQVPVQVMKGELAQQQPQPHLLYHHTQHLQHQQHHQFQHHQPQLQQHQQQMHVGQGPQPSFQENDSVSADIKTEERTDIDSNNNNNNTVNSTNTNSNSNNSSGDECAGQLALMPVSREAAAQQQQQAQHHQLQPPYFQPSYGAYPPTSYCQYCYPYSF